MLHNKVNHKKIYNSLYLIDNNNNKYNKKKKNTEAHRFKRCIIDHKIRTICCYSWIN